MDVNLRLEEGLHKLLNRQNSIKNNNNNNNIVDPLILKEEKVKMFKDICQCYSQCLKYDDDEYILLKQEPICNKIATTNTNKKDSKILINNAMQFLISNHYIKPIGTKDSHKYYITLNGTTVKFNWENIKNLKDKNRDIAELFWLVRKLIVDNLLKIIINKYNKDNTIQIDPIDFDNVKIYSVGSTDITSDYDITLYSNNNNVIRIIIDDFQTRFIKIFGEHSSIIFDTNIYGKAYIRFDCDYNCQDYIPINLDKCLTQKEPFFYIKSLNDNTGLITNGTLGDYKYTQVIWALIKYLRNLRESFGESIYNKYFNFIKNHVENNNILNITQDTLIYLKNHNTSYTELIEYENIHENDYTINNYSSLLFTNDYISLINFYGEETYFTRGSFLDTVVNSQMCKSNKPIIKLYDEDYIASILENAGFFFSHNDKTKYLKRVKNSLILLIKNNSEYEYLFDSIDFENLEKVTSDNYNYCNWINNDDFNLLKCEKYEMYQVIFKIIYKLLKTYLQDINFKEFPFYTIYVKEQLAELRSPKETIDVINDFTYSINPSVNHSRRGSYKQESVPRISINKREFIPSSLSDQYNSIQQPKTRTRGNTMIAARPKTMFVDNANTDTKIYKNNSLSNLNIA